MMRCMQRMRPDVVLACATVGALAALVGCAARPARQAPERERAAGPTGGAAQNRVAIAHGLPRLDGTQLEATVVEVTYAPGGGSAPHSHPCPVIGYVIEGTLRTQVKGEPEAVYAAGESFYEAPNGAHVVSANASRERPARFLAYFVCDRKTPLSVALTDSTRGQRSEH